MIWWFLVLLYVTTLFLTAGHEVSSASVTSKLLQRFFPHLTSSQMKYYVLIFRKSVHVAAYALLTWLVYQAAQKTSKKQKYSLIFAVVFAVLVAVLDERYQSRLPYRTGTWLDVAVDGIGIGLVAGSIWLRLASKKTFSLGKKEETAEKENL